jgi:transcriptional regulator with XRE-family HTH domain
MNLGRFGRGVRALRMRRRWRQSDLADHAEVSRSQVGRIERGDSRRLQLDTVERVAVALGGTVALLLRWNGEGLDRLLDREHARLVEVLVRRLRVLGWEVAVEVSFARAGERGSIDVLAFHPGRRALAVFEVKSVTPDMQAMLGGIDRKARLGAAIARDRGWDPVVVARILVLGDTRTNRRRLDAHEATVRAALPARTREVQHWLADPAPPGIAGVMFVSDGPDADRNLRQRQRVRTSAERRRTGDGNERDTGPPDGP